MKILIILFLLMTTIAFADDACYDYAVIKTRLIKVSDEQGDRIIPDVPCQLYSYYAVSEGSDVTYSNDLKLEGKEIMACVAVRHEDKAKIAGLVIGERFDNTKVTEDYAKHYPYKISDVKREYDKETGEPIEYEGADKDDPARFTMWNE